MLSCCRETEQRSVLSRHIITQKSIKNACHFTEVGLPPTVHTRPTDCVFSCFTTLTLHSIKDWAYINFNLMDNFSSDALKPRCYNFTNRPTALKNTKKIILKVMSNGANRLKSREVGLYSCFQWSAVCRACMQCDA